MESGHSCRVLAQAKIPLLVYGSAGLRTSDLFPVNHKLPEDGFSTSGAQSLCFLLSQT